MSVVHISLFSAEKELFSQKKKSFQGASKPPEISLRLLLQKKASFKNEEKEETLNPSGSWEREMEITLVSKQHEEQGGKRIALVYF